LEAPEYCKIWLFIPLESQQQRQEEAIVIYKFMGGGGNWELGTYDGNWEQPTNFAGSQLLRQVFGAASFWWGLQGPLLVQQDFGGACKGLFIRASFVVHKRWPLASKRWQQPCLFLTGRPQ
jgi:hypothetical protein